MWYSVVFFGYGNKNETKALDELKVHLDSKFEVQKQSISKKTKEICNAMFKNLDKILNEELRKQNEKNRAARCWETNGSESCN